MTINGKALEALTTAAKNSPVAGVLLLLWFFGVRPHMDRVELAIAKNTAATQTFQLELVAIKKDIEHIKEEME